MGLLKRLAHSPAFSQLGSYGLLTVLQKATGFLLLPITTRYLTLAEYGVLETLTIIMVLCSLLEVSAGALPKISAETPDAEQGRLLASALGLSVGIGALLALVVAIVLMSLPISLFEPITFQLVLITALTLWAMLILQPLLMWFRVQQQAGKFCLLVGGQTLLQAVGTLTALSQGLGVKGVLLSSLGAQLITMAVALWVTREQWWDWPRKHIMVQTIRYQSCLILASLALFVTHGLDRLLLGLWLGPETLAHYGILIKLVEVIAVVFGVVESWWGARRFTILNSHGKPAVLSTHLAMLYFLVGLLALALLTVPWLLPLILPADYLQGLQWLPGVLLLVGLKLATSVLDMGCYLSSQPVWLSRVNWLCAALALALYWALIPIWGVWGLLLALNLVYGLRLIAFTWLSQKAMPLAYPAAELASLVSPILLALGFQLLPLSPVWHLTLTLFSLMWLAIGVSKQLWPRLMQVTF